MKPSAVLTAALLLVSLSAAQNAGNATKIVRVPDSETAVKIADRVLIPVYGKKVIESERPFDATLKETCG